MQTNIKRAGIADEHIAQTINYLKVMGCKLGLIIISESYPSNIKELSYKVATNNTNLHKWML